MCYNISVDVIGGNFNYWIVNMMAEQIYNEGLTIIDEIGQVRYEINKANRGIENADFRLSLLSDKNDPMWNRIKRENMMFLENARKKYEMLCQKLRGYKSMCMPNEWKSLLQAFGVTLARTEAIEHVADSLWDEQDLQKALSQTSDMILKKCQELGTAKNNGDNDIITIIESELNYYENDMKSHHWGQSRLESLNFKTTEEKSK